MAITHLCGWLVRKLAWMPLLFACATSNSAWAVDEMPEGVLGWTYYIHAYFGPHDTGIEYVSNPVEACKKTAQNHMGTPLVAMRPVGQSRLAFFCQYPHFIAWVGPHWYGTTFFQCKIGYKARAPGVCIKGSGNVPYENPAPPSCAGGTAGYAVGNPVTVSTGAKVQTELDYPGTADGLLRVARTYRTYRTLRPLLTIGEGWSLSFDALFAIQSKLQDGRPNIFVGALGDGSYFSFHWDGVNNRYASDTDKSSTLELLNDGSGDWMLVMSRTAYRFREMSDSNGQIQFKLISTQRLNGPAEFYSYDPELQLITVTDQQGRKLEFEWLDGKLHAIRTPTSTITYGYTPTWPIEGGAFIFNNLAQVDFLDVMGSRLGGKQYHYDKPLFLTGITDENGARYATYDYDQYGRTVLSEHAGGAQRYTYAYPDDFTRVIGGKRAAVPLIPEAQGWRLPASGSNVSS